MIKIKDTIFNENEINYIMEWSEKELHIMFKDHSDIYVEATFDDIEWNYGTTELEELKLDYSAVVTGYKKLEEENKKIEKIKPIERKPRNIDNVFLKDKINEIIKVINGGN